jgi:hypothetical protein
MARRPRPPLLDDRSLETTTKLPKGQRRPVSVAYPLTRRRCVPKQVTGHACLARQGGCHLGTERVARRPTGVRVSPAASPMSTVVRARCCSSSTGSSGRNVSGPTWSTRWMRTTGCSCPTSSVTVSRRSRWATAPASPETPVLGRMESRQGDRGDRRAEPVEAGERRAQACQRDRAEYFGFLRGGARPATALIVRYIDSVPGTRDRDGLPWGVESICVQLTELGAKIAPATYYGCADLVLGATCTSTGYDARGRRQRKVGPEQHRRHHRRAYALARQQAAQEAESRRSPTPVAGRPAVGDGPHDWEIAVEPHVLLDLDRGAT